MGHAPADPAVRALARELDLVRSAVAMVAAHHARRVVLGSLRFGEEVMGPARLMCGDAGVRIVPLWSPDEGRIGIAVEPAGDD